VLHPLEFTVSGDQAMKRLLESGEGGAPMLIMTDLNMPDGDGFALLSWVRAQPWLNATMLIVLSSTRRGADIDKCYALGADFFLSKFPSPAVLAAMCVSAAKRSAEGPAALPPPKRQLVA
jgi:CheY-like chemotaxis protein